MDENNRQLMAETASLYYMEGMSQEEIAAKLFVSRPTVSRMLKRAREVGIVEIRVHFPAERNTYLENKLKETFGVQASVVDTEHCESAQIQESVQRMLVAEMDGIIRDGDIVGVTRGSIFYDIVPMLTNERGKRVSFVQVMGIEAPSATHHYSRDIVKLLSAVYGGDAYYLDAPLVIESKEAREALTRVPTIAQTMRTIRHADLLMTTIPRVFEGYRDHIWQGYITEKQYEEMERLHAVGGVFGRAFDIDGHFLDIELNRSIIGIEERTIRRIDTLAVCYGTDFAQAALGCMRTGLLNRFVTDSACAAEMLKLNSKGEDHV